MRHVRTKRRGAALRLLLLTAFLAAACGAALLPSSPAGGLGPSASAAETSAAVAAGWRRTGPYTGVISAIATSKAGPSVVYAYLRANGRDGNDRSRNSLFKSTDAGATWAKTSFPSDSVLNSVLSLAVDPTDSSVVYAGTFRGGLFKSTDGGATWGGPFLFPDREVVALAVDPFATNNVYASLAGHGVFKSTNGGATWASTQNGINFFGIIALVADHTNRGVFYAAGGPGGQGQFASVYKTTNGGATWTRLTGNIQPSFLDTFDLVMDPSNSSTLYLATGVGVFKTTDGGATWGPSGAGLPAGKRVMDVAVCPSDPSVLLAAGFDFHGVYRSADGGATWNPTTGAEGVAFNELTFDAAGENAFGGSLGGGVFRGAASGSVWSRASEGFPFALTTHLAPDPNNFDALYAGTVEGIHRTPDGGATWDTAGFNNNSLALPVRGLVADPTRPGTLYAALDLGGVWKTTDGGATWALVLNTFNRNINTLAIDPSNPQTLYFAASFAPLQKTTDGGATWQQVGFTNSYRSLAVDPSNSSIVYAVSDFSGVLKSTNGGTSFARLSQPTDGPATLVGVTLDPASPNTVYVYGNGPTNPVRKSTDGGATWGLASDGLPQTVDGEHRVVGLAVDPLNSAVLYAACFGTAAAGGGVYRSADGGATWALHETALDALRAVATSPSGRLVHAATEHGVFTSQAPPAPFTFTADTFTAGESAGDVTVTVNRADAAAAATIVFNTSDAAARAGRDYAAASGTLTFAPGETTKTFSVAVLDDATDEFDEAVVLNLRASGDAPAALARAALVITDDDPLAALSVGDVSAPEGDFENQTFVFPVSLSAPSEKPITVNLSLVGGTAFIGGDTELLSGPGVLTFAPGETAKTVSVTVRGDTTIEQDETFFLNLSNPSNATTADPQGQGTILNDDAVPTVSVSLNDVTITEGNYGTTDAVLTATLSAPSPKTAKVDYNTSFTLGTLTFLPGETAKTITVPVPANTRFADSPRQVRLSNPRNLLLGDDTGVITIINDDRPPVINVGDVTVREGDSGSRQIFFPLSISADTETPTRVTYQVVAGTATAGEDYFVAGGQWFFSSPSTVTGIAVTVRGDTTAEGDETFFLRISNATNGVAIADDEGKCVLLNDDGPVAPTFRWSAAEYRVSEGLRQASFEVVRAGDLSIPAEVRYEAGPGADAQPASDRSDYTTALGTLRFAIGEERKTVNLLITDDTFAEHDGPNFDESLTLTLLDPSPGMTLAEPHTAAVTIIENDLFTGANNPVDATEFFVRQHYHDFLNREPDAAGLDFWSHGINSCGADQQCREVRRINTSAAFFLSIEFQRTGYQVIRFYQASFAETPQRPRALPRYREFLSHSQELGRGVVVGVGEWEQQLRDNALAFARRWVNGAEFVAQFPQAMTAAEFVDKLFANTGATPTAAEREAAIAAFGAGDAEGRARALLSVSDSKTVDDKLKSPAFVLMQYIGYLRRSPDDPQDTNFDGYDFWLAKLNQFGGNYEQAEMVKAFITSIEYRRRFGN